MTKPLGSSNWNIALYIYSLTTQFFFYPLLRIFSLVIPRLHEQKIAERFYGRNQYALLMDLKSKKSRTIVFFCSSAGEYEQAKPIIERLLHRQENLQAVIFFQSISGFRYAEKRQERMAYFLLAPFDSIFFWRKIFKILKPEKTIVIRHEIWPAFVHCASEVAPLILLNVSNPAKSQKNYLQNYFATKMFLKFAKIFTVSVEDKNMLQRLWLEFPASHPPSIIVTGDTKFDRALERAHQSLNKARELQYKLATFLGNSPRLIVGSAWSADLDLVLPAYTKAELNKKPLRLIIAPHDLSDSNLEKIKTLITKFHFKPSLWSKTKGPIAEDEILVIDTMGQLAELYASCQMAFVGGAVSGKIHNVLEPAAYGLVLASGKNFATQAEAKVLHDVGLLSAIISSDECHDWIQKNIHLSEEERKKIQEKIYSLAGASDIIVKELEN